MRDRPTNHFLTSGIYTLATNPVLGFLVHEEPLTEW